MLDPRIALVMWLAARTRRAFRADASVAQMRAGYREMNRRFGLRDRGGVTSEDVTIPTGDGAIGGRLHRPVRERDASALLVYFHGGGYVIGDVASYEHLTRFFAREGGVAVLSVGYRLGPEHPFPRAHDDAFAALAWARRNARRVAVGGDSAGGGLAAALAAYAHERGVTPPDAQMLIYPAVDARGRFPSRARFTSGVPLTPAAIDWFAARFVRAPEDLGDPLLTPLDAPAPERLPPSYVLLAGYDPLVDEGRAYAARLRAAGVPVIEDERPTLAHGFVNLAGIVPEARRALRAAILATAAALHA